jgi:hypothetical protein
VPINNICSAANDAHGSHRFYSITSSARASRVGGKHPYYFTRSDGYPVTRTVKSCAMTGCVHRVRQWAALFLRPSKKMRPRPRNKTRPHASAFVSLSRGERNRSTGSSSQGPLGSAPEWPLADSYCTRAASGQTAAPPTSVIERRSPACSAWRSGRSVALTF